MCVTGTPPTTTTIDRRKAVIKHVTLQPSTQALRCEPSGFLFRTPAGHRQGVSSSGCRLLRTGVVPYRVCPGSRPSLSTVCLIWIYLMSASRQIALYFVPLPDVVVVVIVMYRKHEGESSGGESIIIHVFQCKDRTLVMHLNLNYFLICWNTGRRQSVPPAMDRSGSPVQLGQVIFINLIFLHKLTCLLPRRAWRDDPHSWSVGRYSHFWHVCWTSVSPFLLSTNYPLSGIAPVIGFVCLDI